MSGGDVSALAALRLQKQSLLPYTFLMAAMEVGNSKKNTALHPVSLLQTNSDF